MRSGTPLAPKEPHVALRRLSNTRGGIARRALMCLALAPRSDWGAAAPFRSMQQP